MSKRLGLVIDQERCIGCEACTVACRLENQATAPWIRVETMRASQKDTPEGRFPELSMTFLPQVCQHCDRPPCVDACPVEALSKREDGPVVLDRDVCDGCQTCIPACPYDAIRVSGDGLLVEKCTLCLHRIDQGLIPFCALCCEGQAILFGDLNDPESDAGRFIANEATYRLRPELDTGPGVYYGPPKKPRGL